MAGNARWQRFLQIRHISQPFKQMMRKSYVLTPAEKQTRMYSSRFADQMVPAQQINYELVRKCDWQVAYDGNGASVCWRDFPVYALRVYLWFKHCFVKYSYTHVLQDIAFYRCMDAALVHRPNHDQRPDCLPLSDVPPAIFSEALHDIEQYLASHTIERIAIEDAEDVRKGENNSLRVELLGNRANLLHEFLTILELNDRVAIEKHTALIKGELNYYRIELGSGSVFLESSYRSLHIAPVLEEQMPDVSREERDATTSEIISKILLLVHDKRITDPAIVQQFA